MFMKNTIALISTVVIMLTVSACSGENAAETTSVATTVVNENTSMQSAEPEGAIDENNNAQKLAVVALESVEFPQTVELIDKELITDTIKLNLENIDDYCIMQQMMSVYLAEVIIVKPAEGKTEEVLSELEARKQALIDTYAFYPNQVASAEATVVGSKGEYVYLICHEDASKAEEALMKVI